MKMKKIFIIFAVATILAGNPSAFAQIFIEEAKVNLSIKPAETAVGSIIVHNTSDRNLPLKAYWEDFLYQPPYSGEKKFLPVGTTQYSCGRWVNFSPQEFTLPPYGEKKIEYVVSPPKDIKGGYYGVLFFENAESEMKKVTGIQIVTRVGSLFFLESSDKIKKAKLENFSFEGDELKGSFTNTGNVILIPHGVFYIMNEENVVGDRGEIKNMYLPPEETAAFSLTVAKNLSPGKYTIVITFDLQEGDSAVTEIDFSKEGTSRYKIIGIRD